MAEIPVNKMWLVMPSYVRTLVMRRGGTYGGADEQGRACSFSRCARSDGMCCLFLAQSTCVAEGNQRGRLIGQIVATALPTIAEELHLSPAEYQWVGTVRLS
jgi:hypothetical protein